MIQGKNKIKYLLLLSLTGGKLDPEKIARIAKTLSRRELAAYYKMLLKMRAEEKAHVTTAVEIPEDVAEKIAKLFPDKDVTFLNDPKIIAGLTVKVTDFIFDASLKRYLADVKKEYQN